MYLHQFNTLKCCSLDSHVSNNVNSVREALNAMMISNLVIDLVLLILGASAAALIALYIYFQKKFKYWDERNVPHAKPSFPFGNLNGKESLAVVFRKLYEESRHERYYGLWQLHRPSILINDPDLIKQVLVGDFMSFHDRGVYSNEKDDPLSGK